MSRVLGAVVAGVVLAAAACGSEETAAPRPTTVQDAAAEFAVRVDAQLAQQRFGRAWLTLHPAQQRFLDVESLAACWKLGRQSDLERELRFESGRVHNELWRIPGGPPKPQPSRAVLIRILDPDSREVLDRFTQHVFRVGDGYRWIVSAAIVSQFRRGACGSV